MVLEDSKMTPQDEDFLNLEALEKGSLNKQGMQEVLVSLLYGMGDSRIQAAHQIRKLTKSSAKCRAYFAAAGVIIPLVSMLKSSAMDVKEAALLALLNLAVRNERQQSYRKEIQVYFGYETEIKSPYKKGGIACYKGRTKD